MAARYLRLHVSAPTRQRLKHRAQGAATVRYLNGRQGSLSAESVKNEERQALERSRPRPVLSHAKAIGATLVFATGGKPSDLGVFAARLVS